MLEFRGGVPSGHCPRCQKCDRWRESHDFIREPILMWDRFPCPPPNTDKARLLLELDWTGELGTRDGCKALKRVASRCKVDLTSVSLLPAVIPDCDELVAAFRTCGTNCVIAIVLACICFLFFLLLIVVCVRYVRRNENEECPTKTTLTNDQNALSTQVNRYYIRHQYMCGSVIPERHALPFEARIMDNGVEARLLKAIQNQNLNQQQYSLEDTCTQCRADYRHQQNTHGGRRQGYERIYWKDKDYLQTRVPSNESLQRKPLERHRSAAGSTSDMSHFYESISDYNPGEMSYNSSGRRSNSSSIRYYSRTNSGNFKDLQNYGDAQVSDGERGTMLSRFNDRELDYRDNMGRNDLRNVGHHPSRTLDQYNISPNCAIDSPQDQQTRIFCHNGSERGYDTRGLENRQAVEDETFSKNPDSDLKIIKGYKYTYNPSFNEDGQTHRPAEDSPSPKSVTEEFEVEDSSNPNTLHKPRSKRKRRRPSSCSYNSSYSESTSLSDNSSNRQNATSGTTPRTNGSFYNRTSYGNR